eukprot:469582_1
MSTEHLAKWFNLESFPISQLQVDIIVPSGINKDNFIVIQKNGFSNSCFIHKYNINSNKWTTTDVSEAIGDIICDSTYAALDTNQNVLYFLAQS